VSKTAPNAVWNAFNAFAQMAISFAATAVVSRLMGAEVMGQYFFWYWIATAISTVANNGMAGAVSRFGAEYIGQGRPSAAAAVARKFSYYQWLLGLGLAATVVLLSTTHVVSWSVHATVAVAALSLAFTISNAQTGVATAWQRYKLLAGTRIAQITIAALLMIIVAVRRADAAGLIVAQAAGAIVGVVLFRLNWHPSTEVSATEPPGVSSPNVRRYVFFSFAIMLFGLLLWQRVEVVFLKAMSTSAIVGVFGIAISLAGALMRLPTALLGVLVPRFAELAGIGEKQWIQNLTTNSFRYTVTLGVPLAAFSAAVAEPLLVLLYGPGFASAASMFRFVVFGQFALALSNVPRSLLMATNHEHRLLGCDLAVCVASLLFLGAAIAILGPIGAALGNAASMTGLLVASGALLKRSELITLPWALLVKAAAFAVIVAALIGMLYAHTNSLAAALVALLIGSAAYGIFCLRSGLLVRSDLTRLGAFHPALARFGSAT
jgi:O-antigen/teichoic acid export membrane protein